MDANIKAVVLAAGKGTRLQTEGCDLPKVMRLALGKPLLHYVLEALSFMRKEDVVIVVGYQRESVVDGFPDRVFAVQEKQLGTGHAVMSAENELKGYKGAVLVCYGDMPLLSRETYEELIKTHFEQKNACTMLTGTTDETLPYGRIVRDENGVFLRVVEDRDCTPEQKAIKELNIGVYVFEAEYLFPALKRLRSDNSQGEYYLTDVPEILIADGLQVGTCTRALGPELIGVNTVEQLREVESILAARA